MTVYVYGSIFTYGDVLPIKHYDYKFDIESIPPGVPTIKNESLIFVENRQETTSDSFLKQIINQI